ncbi:hypothetical protein DFP72DRAFT_851536 [Ephemerocybe angulata]|uniref:Ribonucleoside-diphosphate reductase n=1 Tax=Ephemerocybe angulata TaxID=980116 RepID=A0A8H6HPF3_9AGAR|nr:hypothetical protein DFP72DRAFT_851536 [Tulosesus angulatus]
MFPYPEEGYDCFVSKRNGSIEEYDSKKVWFFVSLCPTRFRWLIVVVRWLGGCGGIASMALAVCSPSVDSCNIDSVLAEIAGSLETLGTDYALLSSALERSVIYKATPTGFGDAMRAAHSAGAISADFMSTVERHEPALCAMIRHEEDRRLNLLLERPQHMLLRAALYMHADNLEEVEATYLLMATQKMFPSYGILTGSGTSKPVLTSCYALRMETANVLPSIEKAVRLVRDGADVGIGVQSLACRGSAVDGTVQAGVPLAISALEAMLQALGTSMNRPSGAISVFVEPWHTDIEGLLKLIRKRSKVFRDGPRLEFGFLINDLFLHRVHADQPWTLVCPSRAPQLESLHGPAFEAEYTRVETGGHGSRQIGARGPFILYKDAIYGTIPFPRIYLMKIDRFFQARGNCGATVSDSTSFDGKEHILAAYLQALGAGSMLTLILPSFVTAEGAMDFQELSRVTRKAVDALNGVGNLRLTNGFADLMVALGHSYDSSVARELNVAIAELVQYIALDQSCALLKTRGPISAPLNPNSETSTRLVQDHIWSLRELSNRYDWGALRARVTTEGLRNCDVTVYDSDPMTSIITGCSESSEPFRSLIAVLNGPSGLFVNIPRRFMGALERSNLWDDEVRDRIVEHRGSIQTMAKVPSSVRSAYRTVWDIEQSTVIRFAQERAPFLCRAQDVRLYLHKPCPTILGELLSQAWQGGLSVGVRHLRIKTSNAPFPISLPSGPSSKMASSDYGVYTPSVSTVVQQCLLLVFTPRVHDVEEETEQNTSRIDMRVHEVIGTRGCDSQGYASGLFFERASGARWEAIYGRPAGELRLAFTLNVDWLKPWGQRTLAAGKHASNLLILRPMASISSIGDKERRAARVQFVLLHYSSAGASPASSLAWPGLSAELVGSGPSLRAAESEAII